MRNLKRALSLVMAAAMLIGMMVVGVSAATSVEEFTDYDSIVNTEAVSTLVNLNIINGMDDGTYFAPEGNVTRAEMCKMIAVARSGGNDNMSSSSTATSAFTDVSSDYWAAPYIEYCANLGIVSGRGGGIFDPGANITGSECAKMLLVTLGYDATLYKLTGSTWEANVNSWAVNADANLYDGLSINYSAILSRDNAAQMIYNALNANVMETSKELNSDGVSVDKYTLSDVSMLEKYYKAVKISGVVTGNEFTGGSSMSGKTTLSYIEGNTTVSNSVTTTVISGSVYKISTEADTLGKRVSFYAVPANNSKSSEKATIIGNVMVSEDDNTVFETGMGYTGSSAASDLKKDLANNGLKFKDTSDMYANETNKDNENDTVTIYVNYDEASNDTLNTFADAMGASSDVIGSSDDLSLEELALYMTGAGITSRFIDNDGDGVIDVVLFVAKAFAKVSTVSTTGDGKLQIGSTDLGRFTAMVEKLSSSDAYNDVYDFENLSVAKNDYVTYYEVNGLWYVDVVDSEVTTVSSAKSTSLKIDGTTHDQSALTLKPFGANTLADVSTKSKVEVYYDDYSNILLVDADTAEKDYLMVTSPKSFTEGYDDTQEMKVVFSDGTTATIDVETIDDVDVEDYTSSMNTGTAGSTSNSMVYTDKIYEYSENSNGTYDLTSQSTEDLDGETITKGKSSIMSGVAANSSTVFVIKTGSSTWKTYTGISNVPSTDITTGYAVLESGSTTAEVVFVKSSSSIGNAEDYIVILSTDYSTDSSKNYGYQAFYQDTFYTDDEEGEILIDTKNLDLGIYLGASGSASDVVTVSSDYVEPQAIEDYSDDTLWFYSNASGGNTDMDEYGIEDAEFYLVDSSDGSYEIGGSSDLDGATKVSVIAQSGDGTGSYNAAYVFIFD